MAKKQTAKQKLLTKLGDLLKDMLGARASVELLKTHDPELLKRLRAGDNLPTMADLVVKKVIALAVDPKKSNQWAVELVWDRIDGKPVQGAPVKEDERRIDEKLNDLTKQHINSIAGTYAAAEREAKDRPDTEDRAYGQSGRLLDVPDNGPPRPKAATGESAMAAGPQK